MKNKFQLNDGGRSKHYDCKRKKDATGDCVIRAIALGLDLDYLEVKKELFSIALENGFMPNSPTTYETFLYNRGWVKNPPMKLKSGKKYILGNLPSPLLFIQGNLQKENILVITSGHLVALLNGVVNDTWDCREYSANSYYSKLS